MLSFPDSFADTSRATSNGADTSSSLSRIAVAQHGTKNSAHYGTGDCSGGGFLSNFNLICESLAGGQVTIVGGHIDTLRVHNRIITG